MKLPSLKKPDDANALIITNFQNDFCKNGSLDLKGGEIIGPLLNRLKAHNFFDVVFLTVDWHPPNHISFNTNHPGKKIHEEITVPLTSEKIILWPPHCIKGEEGSKFYKTLKVEPTDIIIQKGQCEYSETFSSFGTIQSYCIKIKIKGFRNKKNISLWYSS